MPVLLHLLEGWFLPGLAHPLKQFFVQIGVHVAKCIHSLKLLINIILVLMVTFLEHILFSLNIAQLAQQLPVFLLSLSQSFLCVAIVPRLVLVQLLIEVGHFRITFLAALAQMLDLATQNNVLSQALLQLHLIIFNRRITSLWHQVLRGRHHRL